MNFHSKHYGYHVGAGYIGILPDGSKMLFVTQGEYEEYLRELAAA